jgi:hypothetical protein
MSKSSVYKLVSMIGMVLGVVFVLWLKRQTLKVRQETRQLREMRQRELRQEE